MSNVLVIGETDGSEIKNISQQVAAVAAGMGEVTGLVMGSGISEAGMKLSVGKIIMADDTSLENYDPVKYTSIASNIVKEHNIETILLGATSMGKDLGPRLAAELNCGYLGDCLEAGSEGFVRPNFAGKVLAKSNPTGTIVATIRNNAYPAGEAWSGSVENYSGEMVESTLNTTDIENVGSGTVELTEAAIVVSGGRGLENAENYDSMIRPLAESMGAA
ncbi:MAG: electron transfer flavoprotein subunit alpha/FixB family protein, partial [Candidatus Poseidoniales archaeon]